MASERTAGDEKKIDSEHLIVHKNCRDGGKG
jgi:hypothetical protein